MSEFRRMTVSQAQVAHQSEVVRGGCEFLTADERTARCQQLSEQGFLLARVVAQPPPGQGDAENEALPESGPRAVVSGTLGDSLDDAVELSLALRGAVPASVEVAAQARTKARDQLFRVRALGGRGLCLVLPSLRYLVDDEGVLAATDGATLKMWRQLSLTSPVRLLFEQDDRGVKALAPVPLAEALGLERLSSPPELSAQQLASLTASIVETESPSQDNHQDWHDDDVTDLSDSTMPIVLDAEERPTNAASLLRDDPLLGLDIADALADEHLAAVFHPAVSAKLSAIDADFTGELPAAPEPPPPPTPLDALEVDMPEPSAMPEQVSLFDRPSHTPLSHSPLTRAPVQPPRKPPLSLDQADQFAAELDAANGPRPVTVIETLFRTRYSPLREALDDGLEHAAAERAVRDFRASFSRSYRDGYKALKVTGKRPTMVLDAPELAVSAARSAGARHVQLLLVDGMRYDLSLRVMRYLATGLGAAARCVEQHLLWSALPTVTAVQLNLLARGPAGLREPEPEHDDEPGVLRGNSVTTLRRVRIGRRDLAKLDVVEARMRDSGGSFVPRMEAIASETSQVIAEYANTLAPRTLLYVFADHGFCVTRESARTTSAAEQGGAAPEQVLVGGYAWLIER